MIPVAELGTYNRKEAPNTDSMEITVALGNDLWSTPPRRPRPRWLYTVQDPRSRAHGANKANALTSDQNDDHVRRPIMIDGKYSSCCESSICLVRLHSAASRVVTVGVSV